MSITAANATIIFSISTVFPAPFQLQGFDVEDVYDTDDVEIAVTKMGVDGYLSSGFVYNEVKQTYTLQADSASNQIFEQWYAANLVAQDTFRADATIILPALGLQYTHTKGFLTRLKPLADAKKVLQARKWQLTWQSILPSPL